LKSRHLREQSEMLEKVRREATNKQKFSTDLLDIRKQEKVFFTLKEYQKAEKLKKRGD
jgi:hypothetical protein